MRLSKIFSPHFQIYPSSCTSHVGAASARAAMIDFTNYKEGEYAAFSDYAPLSFQLRGTTYACSAAAIVHEMALQMKNKELYADVIRINEVMLKFVDDFGKGMSPRFWSRWDEQLKLLQNCCDKMVEIEAASLYNIVSTKIMSHDDLKYLLIATGEECLVGVSMHEKTPYCLESMRTILHCMAARQQK